jgi:hypothetical protein
VGSGKGGNGGNAVEFNALIMLLARSCAGRRKWRDRKSVLTEIEEPNNNSQIFLKRRNYQG